MNRVELIGRLTKDPEISFANQGKNAVANFTIAVDDFEGNKRETDFIKIVVWGRRAEALADNVRKGEQVGIAGKIKTRSYVNNEGKRIYVTEVVAQTVTYCGGKKIDINNSGIEPKDNTDYSGTPFVE